MAQIANDGNARLYPPDADTLFDGARALGIGQTGNGHGVRGISGRKAFGSASVTMPKTGCPMMTEAGSEHIAIKRHLFNVDVVKVWTQPYRIEMLIDHQRVLYFPDMALLLAGGRRIVEEHKASAKGMRDPAYRRKTEVGAAALATHDIEFRVVLGDGSDLDPWTRRLREIRDANVELMFVSRFVYFGEDDQRAVGSLLEREGGVTTLGRVAAVLDDRGPHGRAMAYSMMARRLIEIDLDRPLGDRSVIRSVPPLPADLPSLRL